MGIKKGQDKFQFGIDFQESILQYTVSDKYGYKALTLYQDSYFTLLSHAFIALCLKKYFKRKKRIPGKVVLREQLREMYQHREYARHMTDDLKNDITLCIDNIYAGVPKDGDDILDGVVKFAQYTELKHELDNADIHDFTQYTQIQANIRKAINLGKSLEKRKGIMLIRGAESRITDRDNEPNGLPTPWWQWNRCLNGGSLKKGALVMFMGKAKRFKTGVLIGLALRLMNRRRRILYIDLENGEKNLGNRADQSLVGVKQDSLTNPDVEKRILKQTRKFKRLGSEMVIMRLPALDTTCNDVQVVMDDYRLEEGLIFTDVFIDYGDLLGDIAGSKDEVTRISNAYLDMKNLAEYNNLDMIATASHVKGEKDTVKREATKYHPEDVAKCKEKIRHLDVCFGLQETEDEKEAKVMRLEVIEQRDGPRDATLYFWVDIPTQRLREFTKEQVREYKAQIDTSEEGKEEAKKERRKRTSDI